MEETMAGSEMRPKGIQSEVISDEQEFTLSSWWSRQYPALFHYIMQEAKGIAPANDDRTAYRRVFSALLIGLHGLGNFIATNCANEDFQHLTEMTNVASAPSTERDTLLEGMFAPPRALRTFYLASGAIAQHAARERVRDTIALIATVARGRPN